MNNISFIDYLRRYYPHLFLPDWSICTEKAARVEILDIWGRGLSDLEGIHYFTGLELLWCHKNSLTAIDLSQNTKLCHLNCSSNQIAELDLSHNPKLVGLVCSRNRIASLDLGRNPDITFLACDGNEITELDLSGQLNLTHLFCTRNKITRLDLRNNPELRQLDCDPSVVQFPARTGKEAVV